MSSFLSILLLRCAKRLICAVQFIGSVPTRKVLKTFLIQYCFWSKRDKTIQVSCHAVLGSATVYRRLTAAVICKHRKDGSFVIGHALKVSEMPCNSFTVFLGSILVQGVFFSDYAPFAQAVYAIISPLPLEIDIMALLYIYWGFLTKLKKRQQLRNVTLPKRTV